MADDEDKTPPDQKPPSPPPITPLHPGGEERFFTGKMPTGRWNMDATERYTRTGRFRKIVPKQHTPTEMEDPTQKIIIFPVEKSLKDGKKEKTDKLPPMFTAPLPKIQKLPDDFFDKDELEEYGDNDPYQQDFSQDERRLSDVIRDLENMADRYTEHLFAQEDDTDWDEIERLERLIPGTDQEEGKRVAPSRQRVKLHKTRQLPPDMPLRQLEEKLAQFRLLSFFRRVALLILVVISAVLSFVPLDWTGDFQLLASQENKILCLGYLLGLTLLLSLDMLARGLWRSFLLRPGIDTLLLFSGIFCLLDCFLQYNASDPRGQLPYASLVILQCYLLAYGEEARRHAHCTACSVASKVKEPDLVTTESHKWQNRPTYRKCTAPPGGFASQIQQEDATQFYFAIVGPLFLILSFLFAWRLSRDIQDFVWSLSAFFLMACPLGGGFLYGRATKLLAKRLKQENYAALAGWPAVASKTKQCVVGDLDIFPLNNIQVKGATEFHGTPSEKVLAYTAAMLKAGDIGCGELFFRMMEERSLAFPRTREVRFHDGGGISGKIGMDSVTVGGAAFTELMKIPVPEGLFVNHGIFCSINGVLVGFYSLEYTLPKVVLHSLEDMMYEGIRPVLATRDFALTPEILRNRYRLPTGKMDFPSVLRRYELSDKEVGEEAVVTAVMTQEGLSSLADCVIAAKRLRQSVLQGLAVCLTSSLLGFFLVAYLVASTAYSALSPDNLLFYLSLWLVPVAILSDLPYRY